MKPEIVKAPIEIFGHPYTAIVQKDAEALYHLKCQFCPFSNKQCFKFRKSNPEEKIGICSVGYKGSKSDYFEPVIICPNRFEGPSSPIFDDLKEKFFPNWKNVVWTKEVNMGSTGNADFVAIDYDEDGETIKDFICIEIQAGGTTGTPYPGLEDIINKGEYKPGGYKFAINWANEFLKTMMQQAYKKGTLVSQWGKKVIFVVQNIAMNYIGVHDNSAYRQSMDDPIIFAAYALTWDEKKQWFALKFDNWYSTDLEGVSKILANQTEKQMSKKDFMKMILSKAKKDGNL